MDLKSRAMIFYQYQENQPNLVPEGIKEIWKKIKGFEKFQISNFKNIRRKYDKKHIPTQTDKFGRIIVFLIDNQKNEHCIFLDNIN